MKGKEIMKLTGIGMVLFSVGAGVIWIVKEYIATLLSNTWMGLLITFVIGVMLIIASDPEYGKKVAEELNKIDKEVKGRMNK